VLFVLSLNIPESLPVTGGICSIQVLVYPDGRMDTRNTAIYCGLSPKTLAIKRCDGTGPPFIKRGKVFYFRDDVDAWLQSQRARSTAEIRHGR